MPEKEDFQGLPSAGNFAANVANLAPALFPTKRLLAANSCRSEAQTGASIAAGRNPTPNFVGLGQVRSVAPSLQIS